MYCMALSVLCGYVCDAHYVYVHMIEERALGVCQVWKLECVHNKDKGRS